MVLYENTVVKYRDGTVKTLDEVGGEAKELAADVPVKSGSTSKPLDEFIQDQIVLAPETPVVDGEDVTTLEEFVEDMIPADTDWTLSLSYSGFGSGAQIPPMLLTGTYKEVLVIFNSSTGFSSCYMPGSKFRSLLPMEDMKTCISSYIDSTGNSNAIWLEQNRNKLFTYCNGDEGNITTEVYIK